MQQLSLVKCFEAVTIGMAFSISVTLTMNISLFFYYSDYPIKNVYEPIYIYISSLMSSYCYILFYKNIESLFVSDYFRRNHFDWKLSFDTFYTIGFFYSSIIFYFTELIYYLLFQQSEYIFHRILLVVPSGMFVLSLMETLLCFDSLRIVYVNRAVQD